jgi:hypothetical protein
MPGTAMMTGEEFLAAIAKSKPKKTYLQLYLKDATQFEAALGMLEKQATALTASGRGVMLFAHLTGWQIRDGDSGLRVDVTFSRFQKSGEQLNITVSVRFVAPSLRDPSVKTKLEQAGKILGLALGKPMSSMATEEGPPVSDPQLQPPTAEARMVVLATFYETLVRAARQVGTRAEDLRQIPLLFGKSAGFDKRMTDVQAGRKDTVNFPSRLKRFMSDRFPLYVFDNADPEQLWFRKSMGPTLDLLLMVDKVHQWGLGKTFTIEVAADFPNTAFGGAYAGWGGTRTNLFWMFHQGWEPQVWAYTTSQELDTALEGCGRILDRILPGLEEHAKRLLTPVPTELPPGVPGSGQFRRATPMSIYCRSQKSGRRTLSLNPWPARPA